jgi:hypothetical protein
VSLDIESRRETIAGIMPHLRGGQIVVDAGTSERTTRRLARELGRVGVAMPMRH